MPPDATPWAIALAPVLAYDAHRVRRGLDSLSTCAARHPATTVGLVAYLGCHLLSWPRWLGRIDPLRHAATLIRSKGAPPQCPRPPQP